MKTPLECVIEKIHTYENKVEEENKPCAISSLTPGGLFGLMIEYPDNLLNNSDIIALEESMRTIARDAPKEIFGEYIDRAQRLIQGEKERRACYLYNKFETYRGKLKKGETLTEEEGKIYKIICRALSNDR